MSSDPREIARALAAPFQPFEIKFKPQKVNGNQALAVPYVDARAVLERLDSVMGWQGWKDDYQCLGDGSVICRLSLRLGEEWITKADVGGQSKQSDGADRMKAAFSNAIKRAAAKFGIGRYLYHHKPEWVAFDPQKNRFVDWPTLEGGQGKRSPAPVSEPVQSRLILPEEITSLIKLARTRGANITTGVKVAAKYGRATLAELTHDEYLDAVAMFEAMPLKKIASQGVLSNA